MKYLIIPIFGFLCYGCIGGCSEIDYYVVTEEYDKLRRRKKYFTIINHTDKTYKKNGLFGIQPFKNEVWKLVSQSKDKVIDKNTIIFYQKINTINPKETINKNEKGKVLELGGWPHLIVDCIKKKYKSEEQLFLLSLNDGKKKVFFGAYGSFFKKIHYGEVASDCKQYAIKYDVHPVWQEKNLTIHIYEDKITFSDPKIKEVKKLKLTVTGYGYTGNYELDPHTLELVDCSKE